MKDDRASRDGGMWEGGTGAAGGERGVREGLATCLLAKA